MSYSYQVEFFWEKKIVNIKDEIGLGNEVFEELN